MTSQTGSHWHFVENIEKDKGWCRHLAGASEWDGENHWWLSIRPDGAHGGYVPPVEDGCPGTVGVGSRWSCLRGM